MANLMKAVPNPESKSSAAPADPEVVAVPCGVGNSPEATGDASQPLSSGVASRARSERCCVAKASIRLSWPPGPRERSKTTAHPHRLTEFRVHPDSTSDAFVAACRSAGIVGLRLHDLRADVSRLFERGLDLARVRAVSRHKSSAILRYIRAGDSGGTGCRRQRGRTPSANLHHHVTRSSMFPLTPCR